MPRNVGTSFLPIIAGAPASPVDGQMWYDSVAAKARIREAGVTEDLVGGGSGSGGGVPPGLLVPFSGGAEPSGWLFANGQAVLRSQYPGLFARIGTTFGAGDGSTTFNVPDLRGRLAVGLDNMGGTTDAGVLSVANTMGATGGSEKVALTPAQTPLRAHTHSGTTSTNSVDHTHSGTTGTVSADHSHSGTTGTDSVNHSHGGVMRQDTTRLINTTAGTTYNMNWGSFGTDGVNTWHTHGFSTGGISANHTHAITTGGVSANHTHTITTGNPSVAEANGADHDNMPPYMLTNWLISTGAAYTPDPLFPILDDLLDVDLTGLVGGQTIVYDPGTNSWKPGEAGEVTQAELDAAVASLETQIDNVVVVSSTPPDPALVDIWIDPDEDDGAFVVANAGEIGEIKAWPFASLPEGWLECNGQTVTAISHPELYAMIVAAGNPFGTSGGNPKVPDYRGRVMVGQSSSGTFATLGALGGAETHTLTGAEAAQKNLGTLTTGNAILSGGATIRWMKTGYSTSISNYGDNHVAGTPSDSGGTYSDVAGVPGGAHQHQLTIGASDATSAHNNLQPYVVSKLIIRAASQYTDGSGHRLVQAPSVVGVGQALVKDANGQWIGEYVATEQEMEDLRQELEELAGKQRMQLLTSMTFQGANAALDMTSSGCSPQKGNTSLARPAVDGAGVNYEGFLPNAEQLQVGDYVVMRFRCWAQAVAGTPLVGVANFLPPGTSSLAYTSGNWWRNLALTAGDVSWRTLAFTVDSLAQFPTGLEMVLPHASAGGNTKIEFAGTLKVYRPTTL